MSSVEVKKTLEDLNTLRKLFKELDFNTKRNLAIIAELKKIKASYDNKKDFADLMVEVGKDKEAWEGMHNYISERVKEKEESTDEHNL